MRVKELLDSGLIGELRAVRASYSFMMRPSRMYRLEKDYIHGGGAMCDIRPFAIHSARWCLAAAPLLVIAPNHFPPYAES